MLIGQLSWKESMLSKLSAVADMVGHTPLIRLPRTHIHLFCKLEFLNLSGSVKIRPALYVLREAVKRGEVCENTVIIESSSGNFALALALLCKMIGIKFIPVIDPNIAAVSENFLRISAYDVVKVTERDETGGYLLNRLKMVQQLSMQLSDSYWTNQYGNPDCYWAYYYGLGQELVSAFPRLDYAFIGVGSGGTITGLSKILKERFPQIKIVGVDIAGSVIFDQVPKKRYIPGIGSSIKPDILREASIDEVIHVSEIDTVHSCNHLLNEHGIFAGGSSGSIYHAIELYFDASTYDYKPDIKPNVVFLCADGGLPYLNTIYNREWSSWLTTQDHKVLNG